MIEVKKGNPYNSKVVGKTQVAFEDSGSAFKVYFIDIRGRDDRAKYEWEHCGRTQEDFLERLRQLKPEGIGFVTAFPHITKVFQFGPTAETNLYTKAYKTETFEELPLDYSGATEVGCAAEILIAAAELRFWLDAQTVDDYLAQACEAGDASFRNHRKMYERFAMGGGAALDT